MVITYNTLCNSVAMEIENALVSIDAEAVEALMEEIQSADKVFFVGVGRVMLSLQGIAKRWAHLGIKTHCVGEITEPAITDKDILIVGSGSGNSVFPVAIAEKAYQIGANVIHIGSSPEGAVSQYTKLFVRIPVRTKEYRDDEIDSIQLMTSLFEQSLLIFGDIVSKIMLERQDIDMKELWQFHANLE